MKITLTRTAAFAALLALMLTVPVPEGRREWTALFDLLHAPVFAVFAVLVLRTLGQWMRGSKIRAALAAWTLVVGFGCAAEAAQGFVGRNPSWHDALANALGAAAGTLWAASRTAASRGWRVGATTVCGLVLVLAAANPLMVLTDACLQRLAMPQVASFEHPLELSRWTARECRVRRVRGHATHGSWALRLDMRPGVYPGVGTRYPLPDWSRYEELVFDIELDEGPPLDIIVKIEDEQHNHEHYDRFHQRVRLVPGRRRVRIALSDVVAAPRGREMDLRCISFLQFFTVHLDSPRTLYLDNICLR